MAEDRALIEKKFLDCFELKLKNFLKHNVCRQLRLASLLKVETNQKNCIGILTTISTPKSNLQVFNLVKQKDLKDLNNVRNCIELIKNNIPKEFCKIEITNIKNDITTNLKIKDIPDNFYLEKLPYRQLQIAVNEKRLFIDLCTKSYQRILAKLKNIEDWPVKLSFEDFSECLKRKEIVTLLIYLNQSLIQDTN